MCDLSLRLKVNLTILSIYSSHKILVLCNDVVTLLRFIKIYVKNSLNAYIVVSL